MGSWLGTMAMAGKVAIKRTKKIIFFMIFLENVFFVITIVNVVTRCALPGMKIRACSL